MVSAAVSSSASGAKEALESSSGMKFADSAPRTIDTITVKPMTTHGQRRTTVDSPVTRVFIEGSLRLSQEPGMAHGCGCKWKSVIG